MSINSITTRNDSSDGNTCASQKLPWLEKQETNNVPTMCPQLCADIVVPVYVLISAAIKKYWEKNGGG